MSDDEGLQKQVMPPPTEGSVELATLKRTIDRLQLLYGVLFGGSLMILIVGWGGMPYWAHLAWGFSLGGAVLTRMKRTSLVNKYNRILTGGGPAQLT